MQVVYGKILVTICEIKAIILYDKSCMNVVSISYNDTAVPIPIHL